MKRAVLLHGTDGTPNDHWFPWIKSELEAHGYEVSAPQLPECHTPNRRIYEQFLHESGWDFTNNILIGHSSGATTILNLLSVEWFPRIKAAVLVGTFLNERLTKSVDWYQLGQFDELFLEQYDPAALREKSDNFIFVHGDDDPYCDINDARQLCEDLDGEFLTIENGHHLGGSSGFAELPGLIEKLKSKL